jgi:hypothetical protein
MNSGFGRNAPALLIAGIALFVALGGSVYAAVATIDGRTIKVKSLPGDRLIPDSVAGNRLKAGAIPGNRIEAGSITGAQIDAATLGQVPNAVHADSADSAHDAETALNSVNAIDATKVNGHSAGCKPPNRFFAGACWQAGSSEVAVSATAAARSCAVQGGELPDALSLAAFSQEPGIVLAEGDEWTGDLTNVSGLDSYAVITISAAGKINFVVSTEARKYRCVIPLVS